MGFSLVGAFAIIGAAIFIAFELLTGSFIPAMTGYNDAYDEMKNRIVEQVQTNILITNVSTSENGLNYDFNITVKNIGGTALKTNDFNILVNGTSYSFTCSKSYLYIDNSAYFSVTNINGTGEKRLKVVTGNGISDYEIYIVT